MTQQQRDTIRYVFAKIGQKATGELITPFRYFQIICEGLPFIEKLANMDLIILPSQAHLLDEQNEILKIAAEIYSL